MTKSSPRSRKYPAIFWIALLLTGVIGLAIGLVTLTPMPALPGPPGNDKAAHAFAFAVLTLPISLLAPRSLIWLMPLALAYGGAIELIQPYVGRSRELADLIADGVGILAGAALGRGLSRLFARRG